ncbi:MAG: hypothetical protein ACT4PP_12660 [Sporichthyaceae bacterium]
MARPFSVALMITAGALMLWMWSAAMRRRGLSSRQALVLVALQAIVVVHALAGLIGLGFAGDQADAGTFVAYALGSVAVLPALIGLPIRLGFPPPGGGAGSAPQFMGGIDLSAGRPGGARDAEQWRSAIAGVACLAIVVMVERMSVTWDGGIPA